MARINYKNDVLRQKWHNARVNFIITWQTSVLYETPHPLTTAVHRVRSIWYVNFFAALLKGSYCSSQSEYSQFPAWSGAPFVSRQPLFCLHSSVPRQIAASCLKDLIPTACMHLLFLLPGSGFNWMTRYHGKYAWKSYFPRATLHLVRSICLGGQIIFGIKSPSLKLEADSIHVGLVAFPRLNFNVT